MAEHPTIAFSERLPQQACKATAELAIMVFTLNGKTYGQMHEELKALSGAAFREANIPKNAAKITKQQLRNLALHYCRWAVKELEQVAP